MSLQGKTALVTGSSRNIGKAIALAFAKEGANVVVNAVSRMDDARAVAEEAEREHGVKALAIQADVSDGAQVAAMIEQANAAFGGVDILVNNPKYNPQRSFVDMPYEDWRKALGVMLDGAFFCIQGVLPHMIEEGSGRIINISAGGAYSGGPRQAHYFTAKMGLRGLTRGLAMEYAANGVLVNEVAPGVIDTERDGPPLDMAAFAKTIPVGYVGQTSDIAGVCVLLAGDGGKFITGQIIHVNGGRGMY